MASKYDRYWLEKLDDITELIKEAYIHGESSKLDVSDIVIYGNRQNWYGVVEVPDKIGRGEMAHARSLGRIVLERGLLSSYNCKFRFVISSNLKLRVVKLDTEPSQIAKYFKHSSMSSKIIESVTESIEDRKRNLAKILSEIPLEAWNRIVKEEPEWHYMESFLGRYGFGPFATLMLATGLNDFKLKGRAEVSYWPKISSILNSSPVPESPRELCTILERFFRNELYSDLKINRLGRFLFSPLAEKIWKSDLKAVSREFPKIWKELAYTMRQNQEAKTISFAMKCLAISLLMVGEYDFDFSKIPIPVDYRVRTFSKRAGLVTAENDSEIRRTWHDILELIKGREPKVTMVHLDSLIWQIARMSEKEMLEYFSKIGCQSVGEKIVSFLTGSSSTESSSRSNFEKMKLCVVPCGSRKIWDVDPAAGPTEARYVYIGSFAKTCREYAEKFHPNSYVILSAKYGFLFPDDIVPGPYNVTFKDPSTNPISVEELRKQAEEKGLMKYDEIVVIAGSSYAKIVREVFKGKKITTPLVGLGGMGHMISALKRARSKGREITTMEFFCPHGKLKIRCSICNPKDKSTSTQSSAPSPKVFSEDRNLVFKCIWMDTDYEGPCGEYGRRWNIYSAKSVWCTQPECPCYQYEMGKIKKIPQYPCYESEIFSKFEYGAGVNRTGVRRGIGRKIRYVFPGKLAIFTTREPRTDEAERYIFGFFVIKDYYTDSDGTTKIVGYQEHTLKIPKECRLKFWNFHRNADGSIFWGTGLYRYVNDSVVRIYLNKQLEVLKEKGYEEESALVKEILNRFYG